MTMGVMKVNRVQKFETKWKKLEADRYAFADNSLQRREDITGIDSLKHQGALQEAAAVFTEEGLQIFAQIFANSVEQAIYRNLGQAVEQAVEKKMAEVFEIASLKMRQMADAYMQTAHHLHAEDGSSDVDPAQIIKKEPQPVEKPTVQPVKQVNPEVKKKRADTIREQAEIVAEYLRQNGRTKVVELVRNIEDVYWSSNPWIKMSQFCKANPNIRKIRNGTFEYVPSET
jgi:hypothetical protein